MKNNGKYYFLITLLSVIFGMTLSVTYKTATNSLATGQSTNQYVNQLQLELRSAKQINEELKSKNEDLETQLEEYEKDISSEDAYINSLFENAKLYRSLAGYTDLQGPGITIEITEPKLLAEQGLHLGMQADVDILLSLWSTLNAAGCEAMSINEQRITSRTEIERAGDHIVINGVPTNTPILVKAIGNSDTMYSALHIPNGLVDYIRRYNYNINVVKENNIIVPKSIQPSTLKYSSPVEEGKE